jgi:2-dehydro-3-deoxygluconokinase
MYDVITIGETMLRLTPAGGLRWEQADQWEMHIGGSESNTAAGLARLGHPVAWMSRLTDNPLGRKIARSLAGHGVDVQHVVWTDEDRIGTYYYEPSAAPREATVLYDRAQSSFSRFSADMIPQNLFTSETAKFFHFTGISLALGPAPRDLIAECVRLAKQAGWRISFDINHRSKLWNAAEARSVYQEFIHQADIVFIPFYDARLIWGSSISESQLNRDPRQAAFSGLREMAKLISAGCIVMTLGPHGSAALHDGSEYYAPALAVTPIGRLGAGDAFSAGFLSGWLREGCPEFSLRYGNAAACLKYSMHGDLPYFTRQEVDRLVEPAATPDEHFR